YKSKEDSAKLPTKDNDFDNNVPPVEITVMFDFSFNSIATFIEFVITVKGIFGIFFAIYQAVELASNIILLFSLISFIASSAIRLFSKTFVTSRSEKEVSILSED